MSEEIPQFVTWGRIGAAGFEALIACLRYAQLHPDAAPAIVYWPEDDTKLDANPLGVDIIDAISDTGAEVRLFPNENGWLRTPRLIPFLALQEADAGPFLAGQPDMFLTQALTPSSEIGFERSGANAWRRWKGMCTRLH